jgi:thioredoxin-like negative regulator of GroEL
MNPRHRIPEITADAFEQHLAASTQPVLVAVCTDGHPASQRLLTLLEPWAIEVNDRINVVRVDAIETPGMLQRCGLPSAPGLVLFHHGISCFQFTGEVSRRELEDVFTQVNLLSLTQEASAGHGSASRQERR